MIFINDLNWNMHVWKVRFKAANKALGFLQANFVLIVPKHVKESVYKGLVPLVNKLGLEPPSYVPAFRIMPKFPLAVEGEAYICLNDNVKNGNSIRKLVTFIWIVS